MAATRTQSSMNAIAVAEQAELVTFAETANREHAATVEAGQTMLRHAIAAGDALLMARAAVEPGGWARWVGENFTGALVTANIYMRLAHYQDQISDYTLSVQDARRVLKGLPDVHSRALPDEVREQALELVASGTSRCQAARELGITVGTISTWLDPSLKERNAADCLAYQRKRSAAKKERDERALDEQIAQDGGPGAEAYALLRDAARRIAEARQFAEDDHAKLSYADALAALAESSYAVRRALGYAPTRNVFARAA